MLAELGIRTQHTETHKPIRLGYNYNGSQIVYREIQNRTALSVSKGDCEIFAEFGDITINAHIVPVYRLTVDSVVGQWESQEDLTAVYTHIYQ